MTEHKTKVVQATKPFSTSKNRGGRPRIKPEELRTKRIVAYFDEENAGNIKAYCESCGMKVSSFIYEMTLKGKVVSPISEEDAANMRRIAGMANNVNQLSHKANACGYPAEAKEWQRLRELLAEYITKITQ